MNLSETIKNFFGMAGKSLPPWAILVALALLVAAYLAFKFITRSKPTISVENSTTGDIAGRDVKKND